MTKQRHLQTISSQDQYHERFRFYLYHLTNLVIFLSNYFHLFYSVFAFFFLCDSRLSVSQRCLILVIARSKNEQIKLYFKISENYILIIKQHQLNDYLILNYKNIKLILHYDIMKL